METGLAGSERIRPLGRATESRICLVHGKGWLVEVTELCQPKAVGCGVSIGRLLGFPSMSFSSWSFESRPIWLVFLSWDVSANSYPCDLQNLNLCHADEGFANEGYANEVSSDWSMLLP